MVPVDPPRLSLDSLLLPAYQNQWEAGLRRYLPQARWFMSKTRQISQVGLVDSIPLDPQDTCTCGALWIVEVRFTEGPAEMYALPVQVAQGEKMQKARQETPRRILWEIHTPQDDSPQGVLCDAMSDARFCTTLVELLAKEMRLPGRRGTLVPHLRKTTLPNAPLAPPRPTGLEQSNSSVLFPDQYFFKLYRKLEAGIHPEPEIGIFLENVSHFPQAPIVTGTWTYESQGESFALGILQEFVPSQTNAWSLFGTLIGRAVEKQNPTDLLLTENLARQLGLRTAQMHLALGGSSEESFCPEPFTANTLQALYQALCQHVQHIQAPVDLALGKVNALSVLLQKFALLENSSDCGMRMRIHGDLHLGQILHTENDFIFVDFEGEPARPLATRRFKHSPLRDVAGMVRSFSYAGEYYIKQQLALSGPAASKARYTAQAIRQRFLQSYFETMSNSPLLPQQPGTRTLLLDFFTMEKALYEIEYEMENRPDWVSIPLRGIQELLGQSL